MHAFHAEGLKLNPQHLSVGLGTISIRSTEPLPISGTKPEGLTRHETASYFSTPLSPSGSLLSPPAIVPCALSQEPGATPLAWSGRSGSQAMPLHSGLERLSG